MNMLKDTGAMDSLLSFFVHLLNIFIGAFIVFFPNSSERGPESRKGTPSRCLAYNNFFDDGIKWKNGSDPKRKREKERKR